MFESIIHPTRRFAAEDRAVTEVIGAILVFALLVLLLVLIQVNAVPAANKQVEFEHDQRVEGDFQTFQQELYRVASTGTDGAVSIETGVVYPSRFFLINPAPATGTIRTTLATGDQTGTNVFIRNATAVDEEVAQYWTGADDSPIEYRTRGLSYVPGYNELPNPGTLHWEHSTLFSNYARDVSTVADPTSFIDGNKIRLTLLEGNLSQSSLSNTIALSPVSTSRRTITVTNATDDSPIEFELLTNLPEDEWTDILEGKDNASLADYVSGDPSTATIRLKNGRYDLSISKVRVGPGEAKSPGAHYLTTVEGDESTVDAGRTVRLVVEARDRYNNPVSGVALNPPTAVDAVVGDDIAGDDVYFAGDGVTDDNGQAVIVYEAPSAEDLDEDTEVTVEVTMPDGTDVNGDAGDDIEQADFDVTALALSEPNGGGSDSPDGVSGINPTENALIYDQICKVQDKGTTTYYAQFENPTDSVTTIDRARYLFYTGNNPDDTTTMEFGSTTIERAKGFVSVGTAFDKKETLGVKFQKTGGGNLNNDLFGISLELSIGSQFERANYFIQWPSTTGTNSISSCSVDTTP